MLFYFIILINISLILASSGDRSKFYNDCVWDCKKDLCDSGVHNPFLKYLLGLSWSPWSCIEDCQYDCQWKTVDAFLERKWNVPQFHGKWPFIRIFGLQEPASAIFSVFNLYVVATQLRKFRSLVSSQCSYYNLWNIYSVICLNAWFWSSVYHTRDTDITERLDYISASVMVFAAFYSMTVRVFSLGKSLKSAMWAIICLCMLINHVAYLWLFDFDYSYNMVFNVIVGSFTVFGWVVWAAKTRDHPQRKAIAAFSILVAVSTLLELLDFPPLLWTFDAHSLWHLSTAVIVPLFYKFIREDCLYLKTISSQKLPTQFKTD